jgi:hypothetical protein
MMAMVVLAVLAALTQIGKLPRVEQVAWLRGCWEMQTREGSIEAQWLSPRASSMLGVSRTIHGTLLAGYEMDLIRERGDRLSYEANPSDGEPSLFLSTAIGEGKVAFENLKEQFPSRVGFELPSPGRLLAWSEGVRNGQARRIESVYDRVPCSGE